MYYIVCRHAAAVMGRLQRQRTPGTSDSALFSQASCQSLVKQKDVGTNAMHELLVTVTIALSVWQAQTAVRHSVADWTCRFTESERKLACLTPYENMKRAGDATTAQNGNIGSLL